MAVTGFNENEYRNVLTNGGTLAVIVDSRDIDSTGGFEKSPAIKPVLNIGFEITPSLVLSEPREAALLVVYGGSWTNVVSSVYQRNGKIVYKKLPNGRYEAVISVPVP